MHTRMKGDIAEVAVLRRLVVSELCVLRPFSDNQRYDLAIDHKGQILRIQCKTARAFGASRIVFNACSLSKGNKPRLYVGEADYFGVYYPGNDKTYFVPVSDVAEMTLRLTPPKNGQQRGVRYAQDYEKLPSELLR